ncbi:MAG TPA: phosphate ABC transporter substrate-binding protein PstS [Gaiellaceae bacterium]|nr:phosphate ABC transporter substrate-binding protein PstS [Gaiellaceae bacterium]
MKRTGIVLALAMIVGLAVVSAGSAKQEDTAIAGAGSSLVNPLVQQWIAPVGSAFGYSLSYASVGSGTGIADISARTVDFGASDAPLNPSQATGCNGCVEIPWALSATTLSYNIPGIPNDLKLSGPVIAGIFLGQITNWNDPQIAKLNPKLTFPNLAITAVHRSDGSGDTYAFTDYLQRVSTTFQSQVGNATTVAWPGGVGASGNAGVAGVIASTSGAIGYISAAYTLPNHLKVAAIQNAAGVFATPGLKDIEAAAVAFPKPFSTANGVEMHIVNPPKTAKNAYPISTYTYVIIPSNASKATELRKLVFWALTSGQKYGPKLIFAKIPTPILAAAEKALKGITCSSSCV